MEKGTQMEEEEKNKSAFSEESSDKDKGSTGDGSDRDTTGQKEEDGVESGHNGATDDASGRTEEDVGLMEARSRALDVIDKMLEYDVDDVIKIEARDDGWRVVLEVVERNAVPDTQDILGRYEVELDDSGEAQGYGLVERYKRGENREEL
ncbi:MAG: gas vesicle protein [Halobacteria archaeon]